MDKINLFLLKWLLLLTVIFPLAVGAQPIWMDWSQNRSLALETLKPIKENTNFFTSTLFLSIRVPVAEQWLLVGEMPFSHFKTAFKNVKNKAHIKFGNPYIGIEIHKEDSPMFIEAGIRLPLVTSFNDAVRFGQLTDIDRFEAFIPDALSLSAAINWHRTLRSKFFYRLRTGPSIVISTGKGGFTLLSKPEHFGQSELYFVYSGQIGYDGDKVNLNGGLTGRLVVTEEGDFGRRTYLQLGFNARLNLGNYRPGIHATIPLEDDLKEVVDLILGVNFGILF